MVTRGNRFLIVPLLAGITAGAGAADWPCWRGPDRNGVSVEKDWNPAALRDRAEKLWTADIGAGFAAVAVVGPRVFTFGNRTNRDVTQCLGADTGRQIWEHSYPCDPGSYPGPRSSPAVNSNSVYTLSREGRLSCIDAETGQQRWTRNLASALRADPLSWGFACSPCIRGDLLILNIRSHGAALNRNTGEVVWTSADDKSGYASPVPFRHNALECVAVFSSSAVSGVETRTGRLLWSYPWRTRHDANATDPVILGSSIFVSTSYGRGCALLDISGKYPKVLWQNKTMQNHIDTSILVNDHIFGTSGDVRGRTELLCMALRDGSVRWRRKTDGALSLIAADGKLIMLTEKGELAVAPASPKEYTEIARAGVITNGKCWTAPVIANGRIYCRSNSGTLVCVDVRR